MIDNNIIYPALRKQYFFIAAIIVIVPLFLFSSIEFSNGYNNNLSLVKYALAQSDSTNNNNVYNTQSNISNQSSSTSTATTTATTNATSRNDTAPFVVDIISLAKQNNNFERK